MDAEILKRDKTVYTAIMEMFDRDVIATNEMIAHFTDGAYGVKDVKKAVTSLKQRKLVTVNAQGWVTEVHSEAGKGA